MNATQKKYAKDKIYSMLSEKLSDLSSTLPKKPSGDGLTKEQKYQQIIDGTAIINSLSKLGGLGCCRSKWHCDSVYTFNTKEVDRQFKINMRAYNKASSRVTTKVNVLKSKASDIIDQIYLGDSVTAMDLIKEFNDFKSK